jgi:patatin-like phospholipase/acyl hydrolase
VTNQVYSQYVLTFDGQNNYIDFGHNDFAGVFARGSSTFSISGWINPHQLTNEATTYGTRNVFFARSSDKYSDNFEFGISESGDLDVYIDDTYERKIRTFGNGELTIGKWHFFAIVFNNRQVNIYLDENEYEAYLRGTFLDKATSSVTLGATLHNNIYFKGQLARISIWNYPCTSEEIQRHRYQPLVGNEEGLVAYWLLNEGQGNRIKDLTGNGLEGNLYGDPIWDVAELPFGITQPSNESEETVIESESLQELVAVFSTEETIDSTEENTEIPQTENLTEEATNIQLTQLEEEKIEIFPTEKTSDSIEETTEVSQAEKLTEEAANIQTNQLEEEKIEKISVSETEILINVQQPEQVQPNVGKKTNSKYKILAIDGGGVRAIIPTMILAEIEKRTQKQIFSLFDLICGTSSGGILALGLTKPRLDLKKADGSPVAQYNAEDLLQIYMEYGVDIFYEPLWEQILGQIEDMFIQPKYSSKGREEIIRQFFGDALLENNLKEVFVPSYDIEHRIPIFFTNKLEKQEIESRKFRKLCSGFTLADAALATSATPTYFAPHRIINSHNPKGFYSLVDGGVIANNPANLAILEAQINRQKSQQVLDTEDILLVSLGTGFVTSAYSFEEVKTWGLLQWTKPLLNIVFDGTSEVVAGELERLFAANKKNKKPSYYRFQTILKAELEAIDNTKLPNLRQLQALANNFIQEHSQEIDDLCSVLAE